MALIKCSECGKDVSTTAKACPHCGADPSVMVAAVLAPPPIPLKPPKKKTSGCLLVILAAVFLYFVFFADNTVSPEQQAAFEKRQTERAPEKAVEAKQEAAEGAQRDDTTKEFVWMERGKEAVKTRLKDGGSAEFKDVYFFRGKDNIPMTCGQVNSKNGFGGYVGFQHFISAGATDNTFLENEVDDFAKIWNAYCTKGK